MALFIGLVHLVSENFRLQKNTMKHRDTENTEKYKKQVNNRDDHDNQDKNKNEIGTDIKYYYFLILVIMVIPVIFCILLSLCVLRASVFLFF